MCGLVGIAGNLEFKDEAAMKRLFMLDFFRGADSTGLASISKGLSDIKVAKVASHPLDLFDMDKFKKALSGSSAKAFIGHNRAATRGVVNTYNAHPYHFGHIVGAHNGTLDSESMRALEDALDEKFPVDSMALFAAISKLGIDETLGLINEGKTSTDGAWSLVWYNKDENSLNFLRNQHRPMWYAFSEDFKKLLWASEWPMIQAATALSASDYPLYVTEQGYRFFSTETDVLYSFDLTALMAGSSERPKPKARALKGKEPKPVSTGGSDPFNRHGHGHGTTGASTMTSTSGPTNKVLALPRNPKTQKKVVDIVDLVGTEDSPYAGMIDREKFNDLVKYGCSFCGTDIEYGDRGITIFERDDICLCESCSTGDPNAVRIHSANIDLLL